MRNDHGVKPMNADQTRRAPVERHAEPEALDPAAAFALGLGSTALRLARPGRPPVRKTAAGR